MTNCVYKYWKWSNSNEPYGKSKRKPVKKESLENLENLKKLENQKIQNNNKFNIIAPENIITPENIKTGAPNKRDVCNDRISQRDMLIQTNINPFLTKLNYVKNIETQQNFLRPQDSNF